MDKPVVITLATDRTAPRRCPVCLTEQDAVTGIALDVGRPQPAPGDLTLCNDCHTMLAFTAAGFRVARQDEIDSIDPLLQKILTTMMADKSKQTR